MREYKFRITYQHDEMGRFATRMITLGEALPDLGERWTVIGKDQYIGHQDEAGEDIYEGDILKIEDATAKVVFWEGPPHFGLDFYHNEDKWCEDWNLTDDSDRMKVIGNIYANPERLKGTIEGN